MIVTQQLIQVAKMNIAEPSQNQYKTQTPAKQDKEMRTLLVAFHLNATNQTNLYFLMLLHFFFLIQVVTVSKPRKKRLVMTTFSGRYLMNQLSYHFIVC